MYTVSELSKISGISPHAIRYYVRSGLLPPCKTQDNSYRLFSTQAVQQAKFIYQAKRLGLAQEDIQQILATSQNEKVSSVACENMIYRLIEERIRTIDDEIRGMQQLSDQTQLALERCQGMTGQSSSEGNVKCLIEAIANI